MLQSLAYFIIGGLVVSLTAHYGAKGQGFVAAFISQFPSMTVLTFALIYKTGGKESVIGYAKSFIYVVPPWLLYILAVSFLCDRIGILWSLTIGVGLYFAASMLLGQLR